MKTAELPEVGENLEVTGPGGNEMYGDVISVLSTDPVRLLMDVHVHCIEQNMRMIAKPAKGDRWIVHLSDSQIAASDAAVL